MRKFILTILFLSFFTCLKSVRAEEANISYQRLDGIYYNLNINGIVDSNHVTSFHLDGRIAYCIEPGVEISTKVYDIGDWSVTSLSDDVKEYIEKVGYYGYEYPGHENNYYYIAAQELIWNAVRPDINVTWTTGINLSGDVIDISSYKSEIESLVMNHSLVPSFAFSNVSGYVGEEIVLEDTNGVLDFYDISLSKYHNIIKDGNTLRIKLSDTLSDIETIDMNRIHYDDAPLLVYSRGSSQKLAAIRITTDKSVDFNIVNKEIPEEEIIEVPNTGIHFDFFDIFLWWF